VFTSGGTEADNMAIRGVAELLASSNRRHLVATAIEHEAVLATCRQLEKRGWTVTLVRPDTDGVVSPDAVDAACTDQTALVAVIRANNEIGTLQPVDDIAPRARARGIL